MLGFHLEGAQNRMKMQAGKHITKKELQIRDFVYVKLKLYRQNSAEPRTCHKLAAKYFGPFPIISRVGKVAYRLQLPPTATVNLPFTFLN